MRFRWIELAHFHESVLTNWINCAYTVFIHSIHGINTTLPAGLIIAGSKTAQKSASRDIHIFTP